MAYQKGEPQLEMGQPRHADKSVPVAEAKPPLPLSPVGYTKGDGMLSPGLPMVPHDEWWVARMP